jgi:AcrR family transcriptional regulator
MGERKKLDRRVVRTRAALRRALMELILERDYDTITVQDITDRADLARATFYLHYKDKEELLLSSQEEIFDDLVARMPEFSSELIIDDEKSHEIRTIIFEHVEQNAQFYRVMLSEHGVASFMVRVRKYIAEKWTEMVTGLVSEDELPFPMEAGANYHAGAMIALISWWLENDMPLTPDEMAEMDRHLDMNGSNAIVREKQFS